jgi:hypothetical protein
MQILTSFLELFPAIRYNLRHPGFRDQLIRISTAIRARIEDFERLLLVKEICILSWSNAELVLEP